MRAAGRLSRVAQRPGGDGRAVRAPQRWQGVVVRGGLQQRRQRRADLRSGPIYEARACTVLPPASDNSYMSLHKLGGFLETRSCVQ